MTNLVENKRPTSLPCASACANGRLQHTRADARYSRPLIVFCRDGYQSPSLVSPKRDMALLTPTARRKVQYAFNLTCRGRATFPPSVIPLRAELSTGNAGGCERASSVTISKNCSEITCAMATDRSNQVYGILQRSRGQPRLCDQEAESVV